MRLFLSGQGSALLSARRSLEENEGGMRRKAIGFPHSRAAEPLEKRPELFKLYLEAKNSF
jgi:hypothetical protein